MIARVLSLCLALSGVSCAHAPRPQAPVDRPYPHREVVLPGGAPGVRLAGELVLPAGGGPFPAALLIAGSGAQNRDEAVAGHRPFLVLADALARRGIASLRYDKRGVAASTGRFASATVADFARDADAALRWLAAEPGIDATRLAYVGHSEGGLVAPLAARLAPPGGPAAARLVLLAGPGCGMEHIVRSQVADVAQAEGVPQAGVAATDRALAEAFAVLRTAPSAEAARAPMRASLAAAASGLSRRLRQPLGLDLGSHRSGRGTCSFRWPGAGAVRRARPAGPRPRQCGGDGPAPAARRFPCRDPPRLESPVPARPHRRAMLLSGCVPG